MSKLLAQAVSTLSDFQLAFGLLFGSGIIVWLVRVTFWMAQIKFKVDLMWTYMNNHLGAELKEPDFPFKKAKD